MNATAGGEVATIDHRLHVVRSPSIPGLADHLAERLHTAPPADAFAPIEVAVPSRGVERWLTQRLSTSLGATADEAGVCAGVAFPFIGGVVQRTLAATLDEDRAAVDPWSPHRLAWPLVELLDELPGTSAFDPLRSHLNDAGVRAARRRFPLARRIADLFDRYALYRPDMTAAWLDGHDVDADGDPLASNLGWQPPLWRQLTETLATPSPDRRTSQAIERLRRGEVARGEDLPEAVTVFGVLAMPPRHLELLSAVATVVPVTLYVISPCPAWPTEGPAPVPRNPLLRASGVVATEAHTVLAPHLARADHLEVTADVTDHVDDAEGDAGSAQAGLSALAVLQADVRGDHRRGPGGELQALPWQPADTSVQVHACHGPVRQLEVLREVLLGLLEDDPSLEPRDIVVLTPDIEAYAPIVPAAFPRRNTGQRDPGGRAHDPGAPPDLPVRVADRALSAENAVAKALLTVLELTTARVTASQVLDLLASAPVRARFGLSDSDLEELPGWVLDTGVSWGIDADHRRELIDLDDRAHTWSAALDRWTLGAAMADDGTRMVGEVLPYDDVEGAGVELLGRVTAATDALFATFRSLAAPRSVGTWQESLAAAVTLLFDPGPGPGRDAELTAQLGQVRIALDDLVADAVTGDGSSSQAELTLEELRGILGDLLAAGGGAGATGSGAITVTGFEALRNVPHRVVCLVGMDDGALPRAGIQHGFDLLEAPSRPGDPDRRLEDRQLLLDAVLSARDHLVVTYSGHDARTNEHLQPAVAISELLDVLRASFTGPVEVVRSQPLQPHSPRYFREAVDAEEPVLHAFDPHHLAAARAASQASGPAPAFLDAPLPPPPDDLVDPAGIDVDDLIRFLEHPVRFLLQRRLGLTLGEDDRRTPDRDPTELDSLQRWQLGQDLLERGLAATVPEDWRELTMATGTAPVGGLGQVALEGVEELVQRLLQEVEQLGGQRALHQLELDVPVPGGPPEMARLVGAVEVIGDTVLHIGVSSPKPKHLVAGWVRAVAVLASDPELTPRALLIGGDAKLVDGVRRITLDPLAGLLSPTADGGEDLASEAAGVPDMAAVAAMARAHLGELVALYLRGHREVVALLPDTAAAYAAARAEGADHNTAVTAAHLKAWAKPGPFGGDRDDAYCVQAFGPDADLGEIDARHPFGAAADRLWGAILAAQGKG